MEVWDNIVFRNFLKKNIKKFYLNKSSVVYETFVMTFVLQQCSINATNLNGNIPLILLSIV